MTAGTGYDVRTDIDDRDERSAAAGADGRFVCTVGAFNWMFPHYRQALFKMLSDHPRIKFVFCVPRRYHDPTIKIGDFRLLRHEEIRSWQWKIPFMPQYITLQPHSVTALVRRQYDVIILLNDIAGLDVWACLVLARLLNRRVVIWGQGLSKSPTFMRLQLRKLMIGLAHAVLFYTDGGREFWIRNGIDPKKLFVAYNTIDTQRIFAIKEQMTQRELRDYRSAHGWGEKKIIVFDGRLVQAKRPDIVLAALKRVIEYDANVHLVIIGDGPMREEISGMIKRLDIPHMVTMLGSLYNEKELASVYMNSTAAVLPAFAGLAILHAFSYGVPLVIGKGNTEHGPEAELVRHGENGFICDLNSIDEFVGSICRLLGSGTVQRTMSANALRVIEEKYNLEKMAAGIVDAVEYCADLKQ
jgi:glycosyltransferase involved in cell wall biosynthesis